MSVAVGRTCCKIVLSLVWHWLRGPVGRPREGQEEGTRLADASPKVVQPV